MAGVTVGAVLVLDSIGVFAIWTAPRLGGSFDNGLVHCRDGEDPGEGAAGVGDQFALIALLGLVRLKEGL